MALFGSNESKEAKQAAKTEELLKRFGLENLNDPRDVEAVKSIANSLTANKFIEFGTILSGSGEDVAKLTYLRALVEQNFIIIRQLDKLISK